MSERYTRLFALPNNLHLDGAPLLIAAGALLKDNQSGKVLLQLKLQNLYHAPLTACKVHVRAFDPSGAELEGVENFSYLDLQAPCGADFGAKTPIILADSTTRRVSACVIQAVFVNGNVWQNPVSEWPQAELRSQLISDRFQDDELTKQYEIEVGRNCKYVPETAGGLSLCTCGTINLSGGKSCCACGRDFDKLTAALDTDLLTQKKEARLAQETANRAKREQEDRIAAAAAKKRTKMIVLIGSVAVVLVVAIAALMKLIIIPERTYRAAEELLAAEDYEGAISTFEEIINYKDAKERIAEIPYIQAENLIASGRNAAAAIIYYKLGELDKSFSLWDKSASREVISAGGTTAETALGNIRTTDCTLGVLSNGEVIATGDNSEDKCSVSSWKDIVAVSAGYWLHNVGLRSDGTVVAAGLNSDRRCDVSDWTDIVAIAAGADATFGLKADGTVVYTGLDFLGYWEATDWEEIIAIATDGYFIVGLKTDGTVVAAGDNDEHQCDVSEWTDIIAISAGENHAVGLKSDGTVIAVGNNSFDQCDVSDWTNIVAISAGRFTTVGLKADGTVVSTGRKELLNGISGWKDIVAISAGGSHVVGLKKNGQVVATGDNSYGQCDVSEWTDIKLPD